MYIVYIIDEYMTVKYVYKIYSVYTGEVYRVYFAIPRLSEDFLGFKQTDSNAN